MMTLQGFLHEQVLCRLGFHDPIKVICEFKMGGFTYVEFEGCTITGYSGRIVTECRWCRREL